MTLTEVRPSVRRPATGASVEWPWPATGTISRTPVDCLALDNPQLSDLLEAWDADLPEARGDAGDFVTMMCMPRLTACLVGDQTKLAFRLSGLARLDYVGPDERQMKWELPSLTALIHHRRDLDSGHDPLLVPDQDRELRSRGAQDVIETVEWVARALRVPVVDVLSGAGISERTWHHWQKNPGAKPRLSSQARLWGLVQSVESLLEDVEGPVDTWLLRDPHRREMLKAGQHEELVSLALDEMVRRGDFDDPTTRRRRDLLSAEYFVEPGDAGSD